MTRDYSGHRSSLRDSSNVAMRYDAYGRPLRGQSTGMPGYLKFLLGFLLPYVVINGLVLMFVIASPKITSDDPDTSDYKTANISVEIDSLLPLKEITASIEGVPVDLVKDGRKYHATVSNNGVLEITARSLNGMKQVAHTQINLLDETAPSIDENNVTIGAGYVEFTASDDQSGVNWDSLYAVDSDGNNLKPTDVNKTTGQVTFSFATPSITVYVSDLAGNQVSANFNLT